jgi:hypothetical protein
MLFLVDPQKLDKNLPRRCVSNATRSATASTTRAMESIPIKVFPKKAWKEQSFHAGG